MWAVLLATIPCWQARRVLLRPPAGKGSPGWRALAHDCHCGALSGPSQPHLHRHQGSRDGFQHSHNAGSIANRRCPLPRRKCSDGWRRQLLNLRSHQKVGRMADDWVGLASIRGAESAQLA